MKGYRDPRSTVIGDWKWQPLRKVQAKLDLTEIPSHVQKFGEFMDETARRASIHGLSPRDLVKAYTITRFSMQRTARKALILRKAGLLLPSGIDDQEKIRPEGAFGHWLHTKHGQNYLDKAEAGEVDEEAIDDAKQKLRTFGKVDKDLPDALRWAPKNLPGREARVSELVSRALRRQSTPEEWRGEMSNLKGIKAAKAGFIAAQLGRGDQPTLDARQLVEHTGEPSKVSTKYLNRQGGLGAAEGVQRLAARQTAMDLSLPKEQQHNYQHLAHHAFWDKAADEVTTHEDVMGAMQNAKDGGRIERARGGGARNDDLHPLMEGLARAGLPGYGHLLKDVPHERLKRAVESIHSPLSDDPADVQAALRIAESSKVPTKAPGARLQTEVPYYGVKQPVWPEDVFTKLDPLRGTTLKAKQQKTWSDLYQEGKGGHFINLAGDRSRSGVMTHIMGKKLAWPVKLYAGPEYMREYNPGSVWASAKGVSSNLDKTTKELARGDKPVYGVYQPMGAKSADSAHHMFDALMAQVPGSGIDKDAAAKFDDMVKAGLHMDLAKRPRVVKMMEKWPGIMNAKEASKFARTLPGAQRSAMVKMMDQAPWLKAGFPAVGMTRVAITDPEVMNAPGNMIGHRYVQLDPDRKAKEKVPHTTYTAPTAGEYGGELPLVQRQYATPDQTFSNMMKDISGGRIVHPYSSDNYGRGTARDMYDKTKVVQPITQEWLDNLEAGRERQAKYGLKKGGRVGKADGGEVDDPAQWYEQHQAQQAKTDGTGDVPPVQQPPPGIGHNQPPGPTSYIKPIDEDKRRLSPLGFYSHAAEAVWKQPQMKASPQQFKSLLLNKHGVKPDEFKWSGYDEAFKDRPMVSKKEVRDHFVKNLPNIQENVKADHENEYGDKYSRHPDDDSWEETKYSDYQLPGAKNYRELVLHMPPKEHPELGNTRRARDYAKAVSAEAAQEKVRAAAAAREIVKRAAPDAEYEAAQKRMVQAHIAHEAARDKLNELHGRLEQLEKQNNYKSSHWDEKNPLLHMRVSDRAGEPVTKYVWRNRKSGNTTKEFDSEEDARAHLERLPESLRPNLELKTKQRPQKILHVEEMQSDWGQDARDKGFQEEREARKQQVFEAERKLNVAHQLGKPDAEKAAAQAELDKLLDAQAEEKGGGVPSAPYIDKTGKWTELGLKRVLHEAATGGYDRIVFTPGSEQAKRYDLSNHIQGVYAVHHSPTEIEWGYRPQGSSDWRSSDEDEHIHPDKLGDHIGKELADKLLAQQPDKTGRRLLTGLDLRVGGEGMKGFYDKIVPTALEKLARQHDPEAKVKLFSHALSKAPQRASGEDVMNTLGIDRDAQDTYWRALTPEMRDQHFAEHYRRAAEDKHHLHALDITPKMRDSIRKGQRAYAGGGRVGKAAGGALDMGSTPYSTGVPDAPVGTAQRGKEALALVGSGGGSDAPAPGSGRDFLGKLANDPNTDGMTRLFAAGMAKSGTFSGQDPSPPAPAVVDPNAKPDYPVNRAAGGRVCPVKAAWAQSKLKASPSEFKAILTKQGVDPDEIKQSGYDDAFKDRAFVSKREVRDHFARATGGRIEERVYQKVRKVVPVAGRYAGGGKVKPQITMVPLSKIHREGGHPVSAYKDTDKVAEMRQKLQAGETLPPVELSRPTSLERKQFKVDPQKEYYLHEGNHRFAAHYYEGRDTIPATNYYLDRPLGDTTPPDSEVS